jgi:hypothetical protein
MNPEHPHGPLPDRSCQALMSACVVVVVTTRHQSVVTAQVDRTHADFVAPDVSITLVCTAATGAQG